MNPEEIIRAQESAAAYESFRKSPHRHVLVVEDDDFLRQMNTDMLLRSGYDAKDAVDGDAAWQALNDRDYDLLITNNTMPKVSGLELLKKLHAARIGMPVIMATGSLPEEEFSRQPWLRPAATLRKPYTPQQMLAAVEKVLREADKIAECV